MKNGQRIRGERESDGVQRRHRNISGRTEGQTIIHGVDNDISDDSELLHFFTEEAMEDL